LLEAFASTCEAVAHAHAGRVLHLDLKPGNVLLDAEGGHAVVIDWGACRCAGGERTAGPLAGTPDYMAPEQADGSGDERSDVFGLGAILHELLTGRPPRSWPGGSRPPHWREIVREVRVSAPRSRGPSYARDLVAICRKALAHDPRDRYPGAADLAQDVRRHLSGLPVSARREPPWIRLGRWLRARLAAPGQGSSDRGLWLRA
jgi:serine/threonine-protein kinase